MQWNAYVQGFPVRSLISDSLCHVKVEMEETDFQAGSRSEGYDNILFLG